MNSRKKTPTALDDVANANDTTALFQHQDEGYLLVTPASARAKMRTLHDAVSKIDAQAMPLYRRAERIQRISDFIRLAVAPLVGVSAGLIAWYTSQGTLLGTLPASAIVGTLAGAFVFLVGLLPEARADSAERRADRISQVPASELLGGTRHADLKASQEREVLQDGSLLIGLRGEGDHLLRGAEALTSRDRDRILALARNELVDEAVVELNVLGMKETRRQIRQALREVKDDRPERPLSRTLLR